MNWMTVIAKNKLHIRSEKESPARMMKKGTESKHRHFEVVGEPLSK